MSAVPASPGNAATDAEEGQHAQGGTDAGTAVEPPTAQSQTYAVGDVEEEICDTEQRAKDAPLQPADVAPDEATSRQVVAPDVRSI